MTRERNLKSGSEGSEGSAELFVVYDIRDAAGWEMANRHRNYWGKTHTRVHYLEENVVVLAFHPAPDECWRPWELVRLSWILDEDLEGSGGICQECGYAPDEGTRRPIAAVYPNEPEKSFQGDPHERCPRCGQGLYVVINVVREGHEGEGAGFELH